MNIETVDVMIVIAVIFLFHFAYTKINPKLDWNYDTGERILWYNDPFDLCTRKAVILYKKKN